MRQNLQPGLYGPKWYHMTPIFYYLIPYVYYLIALTAMWQASFLHHLSSFVYCLLLIVLRSCVYCLPSALFSHMSALLWLYLLCSCAHHHKATAAAMATFYSYFLQQTFAAMMTSQLLVTDWGLKFWTWFWSLKLRLSRSNLLCQIKWL